MRASRTYARLLVSVAGLLLVAACSASTGTGIVGETPAQTEEGSDQTSNNQTSEPEAATEAPAVATATPEPTPAPVQEPLLTGAQTIVSLTPTDAAGVTPLFAWEPVADSARYFLVVNDEAGTPYWSWSGTDTEIQMHGGGPTIAPGYTWSVSAFDATDGFLAISPEFAISP